MCVVDPGRRVCGFGGECPSWITAWGNLVLSSWTRSATNIPKRVGLFLSSKETSVSAERPFVGEDEPNTAATNLVMVVSFVPNTRAAAFLSSKETCISQKGPTFLQKSPTSEKTRHGCTSSCKHLNPAISLPNRALYFRKIDLHLCQNALHPVMDGLLVGNTLLIGNTRAAAFLSIHLFWWWWQRDHLSHVTHMSE